MQFLIPAILTTSLVLVPASAELNLWSTVGTLECTMGPSIGPAMGGRQQAQCVFRPARSDMRETYTGRMERPGTNLVLTGGKLVWVVLSRMERLPPKSLFGRFSGPREDIMVGEAAEAAAALCRGTQRAVCLQPLAHADYEDGDNLAFGISALRLE